MINVRQLRQSPSYMLVMDFFQSSGRPATWYHQRYGPYPDEWWMEGIERGIFDHLDPEPTPHQLAAYELAGLDWDAQEDSGNW